MEVYLDNAATTRVLPEIAAAMAEVMVRQYGNPSGVYKKAGKQRAWSWRPGSGSPACCTRPLRIFILRAEAAKGTTCCSAARPTPCGRRAVIS